MSKKDSLPLLKLSNFKLSKMGPAKLEDTGLTLLDKAPPVGSAPVGKSLVPKKGEVRKEIWRVTSFYINTNDDWGTVLRDAKDYASSSNPDRTLTVAHKHFLGLPCSKACKGF